MAQTAKAVMPQTDQAKISIRDLTMTFVTDGDNVEVLKNISLDVRRGEFVCVLGPSGCGKSTLLNIVGGFIPPTSGQVTIDGEKITGPDQVPDKRQLDLFSHCVLEEQPQSRSCRNVFEKNYRLQDIQLSKNPPSPFQASARQARHYRRVTCQSLFSGSPQCLPSHSADSEHHAGARAGGEYRARTGDLLVANQALSQLS